MESRRGIIACRSGRSSRSVSSGPLDDEIRRAPGAVDEYDQIAVARVLHGLSEVLRRPHEPPVHFLDDITGADTRVGGGTARGPLGHQGALEPWRQTQPWPDPGRR